MLHAWICGVRRKSVYRICDIWARGVCNILQLSQQLCKCVTSVPFVPIIILTFGSRGIWTGLASASPCLSNIFWILCFCDMQIFPGDWVISMPTIFVGSPISFVSHSDRMSAFISSICSAESAKSRRSSTQTVTIAVAFVFDRV